MKRLWSAAGSQAMLAPIFGWILERQPATVLLQLETERPILRDVTPSRLHPFMARDKLTARRTKQTHTTLNRKMHSAVTNLTARRFA